MTRYWLRWVKMRRDLPLRERIVERVVDVLDAHAEPRGRGAVDDHVGLQAARLPVGGDVDDARHGLELVEHARRPVEQLRGSPDPRA